jgi:hypothetical protein
MLVVKKQGKPCGGLYIKAIQLWSSDYDNIFILHRNKLTVTKNLVSFAL